MNRRGSRFHAPLACALAIVGLLALVGCGASTLPAIHSDAERLALAKRLRDGGRYPPAIELLRGYIDSHAGSADIDESVYVLGQCYLGAKDWVAATAEFERVLREYPESDSAGSASFRLGEACYGQSRPPDFDQEFTWRAIEQWQSYLRGFPGHWLNPEAERRIAQARTKIAIKLIRDGELYLKLKLVEPARVYFRRVRDEFGDTPLLGDALIGLAVCEARAGNKVGAAEELRQIETQFAGQPLAARAARERRRIED